MGGGGGKFGRSLKGEKIEGQVGEERWEEVVMMIMMKLIRMMVLTSVSCLKLFVMSG